MEVGTASYACYVLYDRETGQGLTKLSTAPFFHKIVEIEPVPFKGDLYCTGDEYKKVAGDGLGLGEARKIATALDLDDLREKQGTMNSLGLKWTSAVFSEF